MGNIGSSAVPSSPVETCLLNAVRNDPLAVAFPSKPGYMVIDVRPYNKAIPVTPLAVTYPWTEDEVASIVQCGAKYEHKIQARSGGHSFGNYGIGGTNDAIVIDMRNFKQFSMNETSWDATIGPGSMLGDVTSNLITSGNRAFAHGTCPTVGIGGHATIGGLGPMSRMWGAALDHIVSMRAVLANSSIVTASVTENPDLYWALRGAAANMAIVTEFTIRTHPAPSTGVQYQWTLNVGSIEDRAAALGKWFAMAGDPTLPRTFFSQVSVTPTSLTLFGNFFGSQAEFDALNVSSLFTPAPSVLKLDSWSGMLMYWADILNQGVMGAMSSAFYCKSLAFSREQLPKPQTVSALLHYLANANTDAATWTLFFNLEGGAVNDVPINSSAYALRNNIALMQSFAVSPSNTVSASTRTFIDGVNDVLTGADPKAYYGAYPGYIDPSLPDGPYEYWGSNLPRLSQIKLSFDPDDLFHNPQSIPVATVK